MNDAILAEYAKAFKAMPPMDYTLGYDDESYLVLISKCVKRGSPLTNEEFNKWRSGILTDLIEESDLKDEQTPEQKFINGFKKAK